MTPEERPKKREKQLPPNDRKGGVGRGDQTFSKRRKKGEGGGVKMHQKTSPLGGRKRKVKQRKRTLDPPLCVFFSFGCQILWGLKHKNS